MWLFLTRSQSQTDCLHDRCHLGKTSAGDHELEIEGLWDAGASLPCSSEGGEPGPVVGPPYSAQRPFHNKILSTGWVLMGPLQRGWEALQGAVSWGLLQRSQLATAGCSSRPPSLYSS